MRVISIDPGYDRVGIAILEKEVRSKEVLLFSECFETSSKDSIDQRIFKIGDRLDKLIKEYSPEVMAIETLYFTNNQKTVMGVSEARGVLKYVGICNGLEIMELTPAQIKIAITGYGRADKKQVLHMVPRLVEVKNADKMIDDEIDAIAVGLCALAHKM